MEQLGQGGDGGLQGEGEIDRLLFRSIGRFLPATLLRPTDNLHRRAALAPQDNHSIRDPPGHLFPLARLPTHYGQVIGITLP